MAYYVRLWVFAVLIVLACSHFVVAAQECPPGYMWDRRVVGCRQSNCDSIPHAFQNYVLNCVCYSCGDRGCTGDPDFSKGCYRPQDYEGCPGCLYRCIHPDDNCPGEKPSQKFCDEYCVSYHGPHGVGTPVEGSCDCGCKQGYKENDHLLCVPTKKTCDTYCNEYHGIDKAHGEQAIGTPSGVSCDCSCKPGYAPDDSLKCVKVTCEQECMKKMGEGAEPEGSYPDCRCKCKPAYEETWLNPDDSGARLMCVKKTCPDSEAKLDEESGKCVCPAGYDPVPWEGICVEKPKENPKCGDGHCDVSGRMGEVENCRTCKKDCFCSDQNNVCMPEIGSYQKGGCIEATARIVDIGCFSGNCPPSVEVHRVFSGEKIIGKRGLRLFRNDQLSLIRPRGGWLYCRYPYVTIQWTNGVIGKMYLDADGPHGATIQMTDDPMESGWPQRGLMGQKDNIKDVSINVITTFISGIPGLIASIATGPSGVSGDVIKVYVKSNIILRQDDEGLNLYTLEGEPVVEYKGKNTTVEKGYKVTVTEAGVSEPKEFPPYEVGDIHLKIPDCGPGQQMKDGICTGGELSSPKTDPHPLADLKNPVKADNPLPWLIGGSLVFLGGIGIIALILAIIILLAIVWVWKRRKKKKSD